MAEYTTAAGKKKFPGGFFIKFLWIVSAVALLLRLVAAWEICRAGNGINNALAPLPTSDLATYMTLGAQCAAGEFPQTFYYQPYYYAVFLAFLYWCSCNSVTLVIIVQALLSAATVFLSGWCGRKIFSSERAGMIAAFWSAVSSSLILYVPFHQNETLQTFHLILLLSLTLWSLDKNRWFSWAVTGGCAGICILTRGNIWLLIPVIAAGIVINCRKKEKSWKKIFAYTGIFIAFLLVVQLPFIIRNSKNTGTLSGPSTAAGAVLALGNTPEAPAGGREPGSTAGAMTYPEAYRRMMNNTSGNFARSVPRQMWQWFCDDPLAFCELQFRKALLFWDGREIPNNVSLDFDGIMCSRILRYLPLGRNAVIFALGLSGMLFFIGELFRTKSRYLFMLYGFTLFFYASVIVFYILSRFKAPAIPLLAIFAGGFCDRIISDIKQAMPEKRLAVWGRCGIFLLVGFWFSCAAYNTYRMLEPAINRWIYPSGIRLDMQGENIHHFDYGPYPFGGWYRAELKPGSTLVKKFAGFPIRQRAILGLMLASREAVTIELSVNGVMQRFSFPDIPPDKSDRRMVSLPVYLIQGVAEIRILSVTGGDIWAVYDIQRDFGRSHFNGELLNGEWVIRAIVPR